VTITTQSQVMDAIAEGLRAADAEAVVDTGWHNDGTIYAVKAGSLDAVGARLQYNFQRERVEYGNGRGPVAVWSPRKGTKEFCVDTLDELVTRVVALLLGES